MECCVKHCNLRHAGHQIGDSVDTGHVCRIVKRSHIVALLDLLDHLIVDLDTLVELLTAVHHSMTYSVDLLKALDAAVSGVDKNIENVIHCLLVVRNRLNDALFLTVGKTELQE